MGRQEGYCEEAASELRPPQGRDIDGVALASQ